MYFFLVINDYLIQAVNVIRVATRSSPCVLQLSSAVERTAHTLPD